MFVFPSLTECFDFDMSYLSKDDPAVAICFDQWTKVNDLYQNIKTQRHNINQEDLLLLKKRLELIQEEARRSFDKLSCWQQGETRAKEFKFLIYETDSVYDKLFETNQQLNEKFVAFGDIVYATYVQFMSLFHEKGQFTDQD